MCSSIASEYLCPLSFLIGGIASAPLPLPPVFFLQLEKNAQGLKADREKMSPNVISKMIRLF